MIMSLPPAAMTNDSLHSICSEGNNAYFVDYQYVDSHVARDKAVTSYSWGGPCRFYSTCVYYSNVIVPYTM